MRRIALHKGDLNKIHGRLFKSTDGIWEIALRNPEDGFESIHCDKRR